MIKGINKMIFLLTLRWEQVVIFEGWHVATRDFLRFDFLFSSFFLSPELSFLLHFGTSRDVTDMSQISRKH